MQPNRTRLFIGSAAVPAGIDCPCFSQLVGSLAVAFCEHRELSRCAGREAPAVHAEPEINAMTRGRIRNSHSIENRCSVALEHAEGRKSSS